MVIGVRKKKTVTKYLFLESLTHSAWIMVMTFINNRCSFKEVICWKFAESKKLLSSSSFFINIACTSNSFYFSCSFYWKGFTKRKKISERILCFKQIYFRVIIFFFLFFFTWCICEDIKLYSSFSLKS